MSELLPKAELERKREKLLSRLTKKYDITTQEYLIGPLRVPFTRVTNADKVLDQVCEEVDEIEKRTGKKVPDQLMHMPYWAELWDSAFGVGQWLVGRGLVDRRSRIAGRGLVGREPEVVGRKSDVQTDFLSPTSDPQPPITLDLGCGMGFAGTVASILGHRVVFADIEVPALMFAKLNSLPWTRRVSCKALNWQTDSLAERFDLIIGADVLYERSQWECLEPFFRAHLKEDGLILLGEPGRQTGDDFGDWIRDKGWQLTVVEEKVVTRERPIRLFELRK